MGISTHSAESNHSNQLSLMIKISEWTLNSSSSQTEYYIQLLRLNAIDIRYEYTIILIININKKWVNIIGLLHNINDKSNY